MKRNIRFGLMLNSIERTAMARLAETEGGPSQAALLRRLIRQEAHRRGMWPASGSDGELRQLDLEVRNDMRI